MLNPRFRKDVFMACLITGIYDVNRNHILKHDDYSLVSAWANSLTYLNLQGILFHNNFSDATIAKFQSDNLVFIKIDYNTKLNPNVYRYFVYKDFLNRHHNIENLFLTDVSDVVVIENPFEQPLYQNNPGKLFCGDEPKKLNNDWMNEHSKHLRNKISHFEEFEKEFATSTLLNCGIIGGQRVVIEEFLEKLCTIHKNFNSDNQSAYTGDMGAFNYLVRTQFNNRLLHGAPINTIFKNYEEKRTDCWLRHK